MIWVAAFFMVSYCIFILVMINQWSEIKEEPLQYTTPEMVSVLVPVRNEEGDIRRLVLSILDSKGADTFEILVVDDHSEDDTVTIVNELARVHGQVKLVRLPMGIEGKKAGITHGVGIASGDLIVCTDGDSIVPDTWLAAHLQAYQNGAKLSFGIVDYYNKKQSVFIRILSLELQSLVAIGGATLQMGKPTMINGCNYSFSKSCFLKVNGFDGNEDIPTGDDEFLLRKVSRLYPNNIHFLKSSKSEVTTASPASFSQFFNQRIRWASKWKYHQDLISRLLPVALFIGYLLVIYCMWLFVSELNSVAAILLLLKLNLDAFFIHRIHQNKSESFYFKDFILLYLLYPFYVILIGVAAIMGRYQWQGRTYS